MLSSESDFLPRRRSHHGKSARAGPFVKSVAPRTVNPSASYALPQTRSLSHWVNASATACMPSRGSCKSLMRADPRWCLRMSPCRSAFPVIGWRQSFVNRVYGNSASTTSDRDGTTARIWHRDSGHRCCGGEIVWTPAGTGLMRPLGLPEAHLLPVCHSRRCQHCAPPVITAQPQSQSVPAGSNATFTSRRAAKAP